MKFLNGGITDKLRYIADLNIAPPPRGKGPQVWPQKWLDRRFEEVAKAVGGSCSRLQMPLKLALAVRDTVARHRPGAPLERGVPPPLSNASPGGGGGWSATADRPTHPHQKDFVREK